MPFFLWSGYLAIQLLLAGFGAPRLTNQDIAPTVSLSTAELSQVAGLLTPPELTANAALLYDVDADQMLFVQDALVALPPASLTKLMTALLVLERADLAASVTIQTEDLTDGTTMGLIAGEQLTVEQVLYGLLIPSGNDAALVLARHVSGTVDAFVALMNQRAAEMGLSQTQFVNPHGFHAEGHLSSAADLLRLSRTLLQHDLFREIVGTTNIDIAGHSLLNTNQLLGSFPGADGVKTGTTPEAGQCLVASVSRGGHRVLMVILGSANRYADARALYQFYETNYIWSERRIPRNAALNRIQDVEKRRWYITALGEIPSELQPLAGAPPLVNYRHIQLPVSDLPWYSGMPIGFLEWRLGERVVGTQRLVLR